MAIQSRSILKNWFKRGLKPLEEQFAHWIDSFYHKTEDAIPITAVQGLQNILNDLPSSETTDQILAILQSDNPLYDTLQELADFAASLDEDSEVIALIDNALGGTTWRDGVDISGKLDKGGYGGTAQDLKDDIDALAGSAGSEVVTYPDIPTMLGDQGNQEDKQIFEVTDASKDYPNAGQGDSTVDQAGTKAWYRYKGVANGLLSDYIKISEEEAFSENLGLSDYFHKINDDSDDITEGANNQFINDTVNEVTVATGTYTLDQDSRVEKRFKTSTTISTDSDVDLQGGSEGDIMQWTFKITGTVILDFTNSTQAVECDSDDSRWDDTTDEFTLEGDTDSKFEMSAYYEDSVWRVKFSGKYTG